MVDKDDFDNWRVGMVVYHKTAHRAMVVEMFHMDDFSSRFCDRLSCTWQDGNKTKRGIFNYDEIDILGVHVEGDV